MSTHNVCFYGEIRLIIPELSPNTPPKQSSVYVKKKLSYFYKKNIFCGIH